MKRWTLAASIGVLCFAFGSPALGQSTYPTRAIRILVPQSAGSGGDLVARLLGERLRGVFNLAIVFDNRPGANGVVAAVSLAKEASDGYTLMLPGVSQISFNQHLYKSIGYDAFKDFTFVAPVVDTPFVLVASKQSGIKDLAGLIVRARAKPGSINFASAGTGNSTHLAMEMLASKASIQLTHVTYRGSGPALLSVVSGETESMVSVLGTALPQIANGKVVPLAVFGDKRFPQLPGVPTLKEAGVDVPAMPGWYALVAPVHLDQKIVDRLASAVQQVLAEPEIKAKLGEMSLEPIPGTGADIRRRAEVDAMVWGDFIKRQGIQAD